ncbi:REP-associated tyrosine transposase [Pseudomonas kurunegalensis]|uniref:REP-associated tyrosine transposase n=1 Tax=Pseudomonas kurunegalensis TaxID=485880 RepID=UPI00256FB9FC|nr:transposase [Pseudomonas kurunegalensis]WJD64049.1 transposase [Pseudomonas kurunegalensis]
MHFAHAHHLRRHRVSHPGRVYMLTTVTHQRRPLLHNFALARLVITHLRQADQENSCVTLAYVVMPDHVHWMIELKQVTLATLMRRFKSRSSLALHKAGVISTPIWQAGYCDRAMRKDDDLLNAARYIIANPVRTGLAPTVGDYPHWDAIWL